MEQKTQNMINKVVAIFISCLMLVINTGHGCAESVTGETGNTVNTNTVTDAEVKAFKIGAVFAAVVGVVAMGSYFPIKEAKNAVDYHVLLKSRHKNFVKSFPNSTVDKKCEKFTKQDGYFWDWAACLGYVIQFYKGDTKLSQKDIVKKLFDKCALFKHNRKESLPINAYYRSELLESIEKFANENGMVFVRELCEFGMAPKLQYIKDKITKFYESNGSKPFVINDSYFYKENPFTHFVVISEIDSEGVATIRDPMVGLIRKQPLEAFCQGYISDNGHAKLPSMDMFTLKPKK